MANALGTEKCATELAKLLDAQAVICRQILDKSKQQQQLVEERKEDALLTLLNDKQMLIHQNDKLSKQATPYRGHWENGLREQATPEQRALVEKSWNALLEVLDEILKLEDASRAVLESHKNSVSLDIGNLQRGKMLNKAYGGAATYRPPAAPRYSDKQG
mgnify:CR=1 FL=1